MSYYTKIIKLSERIDYSSDLWIINKDEWKAGFDKVLNFAKLIKEYMTTYDEINQNRYSNEGELKTLQQKLLSTISKLIDLYNDPDSGINYNSISYSLNEKGIAEIRKGIELVKAFEHEVKTKLALYNPANAIVQGITKAAQDLQDAISNAQEAIDNKQSEIDEINRQISDLALTPDEQGAADLKSQKEQELSNKKAEKEQLEQDKTSKQSELNEINRRLSETQLANLGKNSLAVGTNAFSSGNDSIAIGTNSTVTANDGIAISQDSSVTGNCSGTFDAQNVIHADDAYAIGNNNTLNENANNTFVLGNNVVTDVVNSVALGNSTTLATAVATPNMEIRGSTHNFAGTTPVGVVSIGAENAERTITHVAAGRVTAQSTDAINGSQLYALADAVNNLQLDAINPDDVSDAIQNAISNNIRAGANVTIDEDVNPDNNQKTFTINAVQPTLKAGDNIEIVQDGNNYTFKATQPELVGGQGVTLNKEGNRITIEAEGKTYTAGDNVSITPDNKINVNGTTVSSGAGITVTTTTSTGANGATNTNYEVALSDTLKAQIAKEESVTAGSSNVIVKQEGTSDTGGKHFVVDIAKNLDLTETGSLKMCDINLAVGNVNMGSNVISGVTEGNAPTDAVNVSQLNAAKSSVKAGDKVKVTHEKQDYGSTVYTVNALTSHVAGGKNVVVDKTAGENGEDKFTVNVAGDLTDINSIKKGDTGFTFGDNNIDVGGATLSNIGTPVNDNDAATKSYVDNSRTSVTSTDATVRVVKTVVNAMTGAVNYDLSVIAKAPEFTFGVGTKDEIKFKDGGHLNIVGGSDAIETKVDGNTIKVDLSEAGKATLAKVNNGIHSQTDDGKTLNYQLGDTIKVTGDCKNLATTTTAEGKVSVRLNDDVKVNSVTTGNVSISTQGINAGGNKVVNVANGHISPTSKDAVNGSQLYATNIQVNQNTQNIANLGDRVNHLDNKINRVNKDLRAGVAGSAAIAGLPQVRGHGKSMVAASAGNYKGQSAIAIGYSRASDNGKVLFKLSGSANTQGDIVSSIGLGYEW